MALLPTSLGTRPRLAIEIRPEGVVAARSEDAQAMISAAAYSLFAEGIVVPSLKPVNISRRAETVVAVRKALEAVALKERQTTVVLPDAAVRVLLLDFDALPAKVAEALPVVRFRLKKLLPFDADEAVISYQVMSTQRGLVRVLAVAVPKDVLAEYESVIREAGFEPGAVLPSTLAACAGLTEMEAATLLVNAGETSITTAIVQGGVLLLHRTVDLAAEGLHERAQPPAEVHHPPLAIPQELLATNPGAPGLDSETWVPATTAEWVPALPLVDPEETAEEWAMQPPVSGYGVLDDTHIHEADAEARRLAAEIEADILADIANDPAPVLPREAMLPPLPTPAVLEDQRLAAAAREVTQAVSVAAAYFEDTLQSAPGLVLAAGTMGAETLDRLLRQAGFAEGEIRVREMFESVMLTAGATTTRVPHGWMAGVRGALRS